jgi:hypothetical protein
MREFRSLEPEKLPEWAEKAIVGDEPIVEVEYSRRRIVVSYTFPGFYVVDDARDVEGEEVPFTQINIEATGYLVKSGWPELPCFARYVQIPFNFDYKVTVEKGKPVEFYDILVLPAQEHLMDSPDEEYTFEYNKELYTEDLLYPEEIVEVEGPFNIDDYTALLVRVVPFQYNPAKRMLIGYGNVTITIDLTPRTDEVVAPPSWKSELDRKAFGNFFVNPGRRSIYDRLEIDPGMVPFADAWALGPEYLIIFHETFRQAADRLAQWKNRRGLRTETVSIGTVGNSVDKIKSYVRGRKRNESRLRYVLLFGDVDMIESYDTSVEPWKPPPPPSKHFWGNNITDYYYSTLRDPQGQGQWVPPVLAIGRIPVRTADEGLAVVDQIISYEKSPPTDSEYYKRVSFAAYFQDRSKSRPKADGRASRWYMKTMEEIREKIVSQGFDVERIYVSETPDVRFYEDETKVLQDVIDSIVDGTTATNRLIEATTEGRLIVAHRDHGLKSGWHEPPFGMSHLDAVSGQMPTLFYSVNCLTGKFDLQEPREECFAEKILRMTGAAPSLIAATRRSHTKLNDALMKALFDGMWGTVLPTYAGTGSHTVRHNRLGDLLNYAKVYLPVSASASSEYIKDHYEIYHVIGDPTLELWKEKPREIQMQAWLDKFTLRIRLSDCPENTVVTIWHGEKMVKRVELSDTTHSTPLKGIPGLPWPPPSHAISVCFWAPGYRFFEVNPKVDM